VALAALGLVLTGRVATGAELSTSDFFRPWQFQRAVLSPTGEYVATLRSVDGWLKVEVVDPRRGVSLPVFRAEELLEPNVGRLIWLDSDSFFLTYTTGDIPDDLELAEELRSRNVIVDINRFDDELALKWQETKIEGWIVQPLPLDDEFLLFSPTDAKGELHRIRPRDLMSPVPGTETGLTEESLVAEFDGVVPWWICDPDGTPRVVISVGERGKWRIRHRYSAEEKWKTVLSGRFGSEPLDLFPIALTEDGKQIIVASGRDPSTISLRKLDPETRELGEILYERAWGEFKDILFDHSRSRIRGVVFIESGQTRFHYFSSVDRERSQKLDELFPGRHTTVEDSSADGERLVVHVGASDDPGTVWYVDLEGGFRKELGQVAPWLVAEELAKVKPYRVESKDGRSVEALIALPKKAEGKPPLVVFPHGGPIGVMDEADFSPEVQHLANGGFAVLQVNYRGSSGYGEEFLSAGKGQWGRGIEDDIDAAVEHAIEEGWVDPERMCVVGASYGGYSALMSVIRHPSRYRCAATHAGVTDLALMLTTADSTGTEEARAAWYEILGDPRVDYEAMKAVSPVYRVAEIQVPLLITHGSKDERVHIEHADRLRLMLDAHDKKYDWHLLEDHGHQFDDLDTLVFYYATLKSFLWDHLDEVDAD